MLLVFDVALLHYPGGGPLCYHEIRLTGIHHLSEIIFHVAKAVIVVKKILQACKLTSDVFFSSSKLLRLAEDFRGDLSISFLLAALARLLLAGAARINAADGANLWLFSVHLDVAALWWSNHIHQSIARDITQRNCVLWLLSAEQSLHLKVVLYLRVYWLPTVELGRASDFSTLLCFLLVTLNNAGALLIDSLDCEACTCVARRNICVRQLGCVSLLWTTNVSPILILRLLFHHHRLLRQYDWVSFISRLRWACH